MHVFFYRRVYRKEVNDNFFSIISFPCVPQFNNIRCVRGVPYPGRNFFVGQRWLSLELDDNIHRAQFKCAQTVVGQLFAGNGPNGLSYDYYYYYYYYYY